MSFTQQMQSTILQHLYCGLHWLCQPHRTFLLPKMSFAMENPLTKPLSVSLLQCSLSFRLREFEIDTVLYTTCDKICTFLPMASENQHFNLFATMLKIEMLICLKRVYICSVIVHQNLKSPCHTAGRSDKENGRIM